MLFNSYIFLFVFLPIVLLGYFLLNKKQMYKESKYFLVASSLFFYAWWNLLYLPILLGSLTFNYVVGSKLHLEKGGEEKSIFNRKTLLFLGISANISLLAYFKYVDFFIENFNFLFDESIPLLHIMLPLAISFFTFQQIAYLVDSYRGETSEYNFLNYALFVTFFPQLIAGPIVHHKEMMPQFFKIENSSLNSDNITKGLFIFSIGLFKKVVIADTFAIWATEGFDNTQSLDMLEAWATSLSYTFQLYFDFSGYTDMAIGIALLFNIKLPINFFSPYKATSIQDFWRRWHITLSRFLKEYIYFPLGGNRKGEFRTYTNLFSTFLLGGIWHGAGWTFVVWGALHGFTLVIHRFWSRFGISIPKVLAWFITFNFINIAWVFFRAEEFSDALEILRGMFGLNGVSIYGDISQLYIMIGFIIVLFFNNTSQLFKNNRLAPYMFFISCLLFVFSLLQMFNISISNDKVSEFLYFNF